MSNISPQFLPNPGPWAVRPLVPEPVYTDRQEHLSYLHDFALETIHRRSASTVLLGQRRMGKTEIFKRVVNRLFFEQPGYADPRASVVPVYFSFQDTATDRWDFAEKYVENFLRWYAAFRLRDSSFLSRMAVEYDQLVQIIRERLPLTEGIEGALNLAEALPGRNVTMPEEWALWLPRRVSDWDESSIVMFLDEFQNTRLPQYSFDIVGLMQEAVESPTCPHFVTGSAMSILASEILGRGSLFGRFRNQPIGPLTEYWGTELALKSAGFYQARLPEDMAPVLATRCGGNPFYITAVIRQSVEQNKILDSEERINEILAVDLSSGFIWGELNDQVSHWIERINEQGITKWILYLSVLDEGEYIDLQRIQRQLREKEDLKVSPEDIRNVLIKLSRGDLLEYIDGATWFRKVNDPILVEFLKVWGRIVVEGRSRERVEKEIQREYQILRRQVRNHLGYLGEVYMAQVLWNSQRQTLPGRLLHHPEDVTVPWRFNYIKHRTSLGEGQGLEMDLEAAAGIEMWLGESKWWTDRKVGSNEIHILLRKARLLQSMEGPGLRILRLWFFSHSGFTAEAQELMTEHGVFWSDKDDLNGLLDLVGLKRLPEVGGECEVGSGGREGGRGKAEGRGALV